MDFIDLPVSWTEYLRNIRFYEVKNNIKPKAENLIYLDFYNKYCAEDPTKQAEYQKTYKEKHKEKIKQRARERYLKIKESQKKYYLKNKEKINAKRREYYLNNKIK
jgi:hypothetical protein